MIMGLEDPNVLHSENREVPYPESHCGYGEAIVLHSENREVSYPESHCGYGEAIMMAMGPEGLDATYPESRCGYGEAIMMEMGQEGLDVTLPREPLRLWGGYPSNFNSTGATGVQQACMRMAT